MRLILLIVFAMLPMRVAALCAGVDYLDTLDADERATLDAAVAGTPYADGLLWQATRGPDTITLIGTMHIYDDRLLPLYLKVADFISEAELLLVEAGPEEEATMTAQMAAQPDLVFVTEGPTLPERLDEATWQMLADAARDRYIPPFLAAKMQPWYLMLNLSIPACAMQDLIQGAGGLDKMLMERATDSGTPIQALEPWDTLFTVMQFGTPEEQLEMLQLSVMPTALQTQMYVGMLNAYFAGEVARIWEASRLAAQEIPGLDPARAAEMFRETEKLLLTDRNRNWMPVIAQAAENHDTIVVAAGAAHFPGESGVLNMLAQDGWTITPLP